jgi:hypothetical protein
MNENLSSFARLGKVISNFSRKKDYFPRASFQSITDSLLADFARVSSDCQFGS